jgi:predicted nuclease with TOPRIM domain
MHWLVRKLRGRLLFPLLKLHMRSGAREIRTELNQVFEVALQVANAVGPIRSTPPPKPTTGDIKEALWKLQAVWAQNTELRKEAEKLKASIHKNMDDLLGVRMQLAYLDSQARKTAIDLGENHQMSAGNPTAAEFIDGSSREIQRLKKLIVDGIATAKQRNIFEQLRVQLTDVQDQNRALHDDKQNLEAQLDLRIEQLRQGLKSGG